MDGYSLFSIIGIILLIFSACAVLVHLFLETNRVKRINYVRRFRKGKCVVIFIIAFPLYFLGYYYQRVAGPAMIAEVVSNPINDVRDLVLMKYKFSGIRQLMIDNRFYCVAIYLCAVMVLLNAGLFALSFLQQAIWERTSRARYFKGKGSHYLFLGNNKGNLELYQSVKGGFKAILGIVNEAQSEEYYKKGVVYFENDELNEVPTKLIKQVFREKENKKSKLEKLYIIVNTNDDFENIKICEQLSACLWNGKKQNKAEATADPYRHINIYVYGNPQYDSLYNRISNESGCFRLVDRYNKVAMDFVMKYPLSLFITDKQIDPNTFMVRDGIDINVIMIGFGETNRYIYENYIRTNQFITAGKNENDVALKQVNYHIFDKDMAQEHKRLNYSCYRYRNEFYEFDDTEKRWLLRKDINTEDYLPLPELPSNDSYHNMDVNSVAFFEDVTRIIQKNSDGINYVIVAYGNDLENADLAYKIRTLISEKGINKATVFSRSREKIEDTDNDFKDVVFFGNEESLLYDIKHIDDTELITMSLLRNRMYKFTQEVKAGIANNEQAYDEKYRRIRNEYADEEWYFRGNAAERWSNVYATLSIRAKLLMMGLDIKKHSVENRSSLDLKEYMDIYADGDYPPYEDFDLMYKYGPLNRGISTFIDSRARNMAVLEHLRWNAFMISVGVIPPTINKVESDKKNEVKKPGKNYSLRYHSNVTTYEGLIKYRKLVAKKGEEDKVDVIGYDYQVLDSAWWVLREMGYDVIRKSNYRG